jgi:hypothetical protein
MVWGETVGPEKAPRASLKQYSTKASDIRTYYDKAPVPYAEFISQTSAMIALLSAVWLTE